MFEGVRHREFGVVEGLPKGQMGRRKGELTLLMEIASKWPWKVSVALVPLSYVVHVKDLWTPLERVG